MPVLEKCLANNFEPIGLFKPAAVDFHSSLPVIFSAHWFLEHGYTVSSCESKREQEPIFDFSASNSNNNFLVEVFSPRTWEGLSDFNEELRLALLHLDCPYNFSYIVNIDISQSDFDRDILHFDPWDFSQVMKTPKSRFDIIGSIRKTVLDKLGTDASPFAFDTDVTGKRTIVRINVNIDNITHNLSRLPNRLGTLLNSLSDYAPEGIFDQVLRRNILNNKLQDKQLPNERPKDGIRVLLIDVTRLTFLADEFQHPTYQKSFLDSIEKHLLKRTGVGQGVDLIIFSKTRVVPQFVFCCACGAYAENEIAAFVGDDRQIQVLRRCGEFVVMGEVA